MMTMGNYLDENGDFYLTKNTAGKKDFQLPMQKNNLGMKSDKPEVTERKRDRLRKVGEISYR